MGLLPSSFERRIDASSKVEKGIRYDERIQTIAPTANVQQTTQEQPLECPPPSTPLLMPLLLLRW